MADAWFDHCISDYVVEHIADPVAHLAEFERVLKPVFRTPNRFHYTALISSATPHWFHELVANRARALPRAAHDPHPTVYAMNIAAAVRRAASLCQLQVERLIYIEKEPFLRKILAPGLPSPRRL